MQSMLRKAGEKKVSDLTKTIKLRIHVSPEQEILFQQMTEQYRQACNFVSQYIFDNQFNVAYQSLNKNYIATFVRCLA